jgi:predicted ABC-type ATPase
MSLNVIERRYYRGIFNLINLYIPICDSWMVVSNKDIIPELVAKGVFEGKNMVLKWKPISPSLTNYQKRFYLEWKRLLAN